MRTYPSPNASTLVFNVCEWNHDTGFIPSHNLGLHHSICLCWQTHRSSAVWIGHIIIPLFFVWQRGWWRPHPANRLRKRNDTAANLQSSMTDVEKSSNESETKKEEDANRLQLNWRRKLATDSRANSGKSSISVLTLGLFVFLLVCLFAGKVIGQRVTLLQPRVRANASTHHHDNGSRCVWVFTVHRPVPPKD